VEKKPPMHGIQRMSGSEGSARIVQQPAEKVKPPGHPESTKITKYRQV
jgi:hypothetical protein